MSKETQTIGPYRIVSVLGRGSVGAVYRTEHRRTGRTVAIKTVQAPSQAAGGVFFWEGILKFVYANQGVGRFTKLGLPFPELTATFVGSLEIVGGLMLLLGLATRFTTLPFIVEMLVAMLTTKISLFLGTYPLPPPPAPPVFGFWAVLHEVRSEYAQLLTCAFLFIEGPGVWSLDALLGGRAGGGQGEVPAVRPYVAAA